MQLKTKLNIATVLCLAAMAIPLLQRHWPNTEADDRLLASASETVGLEEIPEIQTEFVSSAQAMPGDEALTPEEALKPEDETNDPSEHELEIGLEIFQKLSISARRDGFLASGNLVPGTIISKGETLATLDVQLKLLEYKKIESEMLALAKEAGNSTDLARARKELQVSEVRNYELGRAAQLTRIPRLEMVEAQTNLDASRAALDGELARRDEVRFRYAAKKAELEILQLELEQSQIIAPFDGIVFKQHKHVGEAVTNAEPMAEIYRLDYLLGTVLLKQNEIAPEEFLNFSGKVKINLPRKGVRTFEFEKPTALPRVERDGRFLAVIKIRNRKSPNGESWELLPGMQGLLLADVQSQDEN